jgi:aspartate/methionine/tyrosine aminotransferase
MRPSQDLLLKCHRELDAAIRSDQRRCFVSGWHVENPLASRYLDVGSVMDRVRAGASKYQFLSDNRALVQSIRSFHRQADGVEYAEDEMFVAAGSSPLILATMATLKSRGVRRVFYFPPVYYAFFYWASVFGIEMVPLTRDWPAIRAIDLPLPSEPSVLLFSDPAWVVGRFIDPASIEAIARWQAKTRSLIIIDGTFQYTKWDPAARTEFSSWLDRHATFRLVCPTKALGVNGIRFAYLLLPSSFREDVRYAASNASGASDTFNVAAAFRIMEVLNSEEGNSRFIERIRMRNDTLTGVLHERQAVEPTCSYYVFSPLLVPSANCIAMDERYFEGPANGGFRVNLMVPQHELDKLAVGSATGDEPAAIHID